MGLLDFPDLSRRVESMFRHIAAAACAALWVAVAVLPAAAQAPAPPPNQPPSQRIALVIGNGNYARGPLQTSLNDAGLVAEALRSIGFDIVDGADLGQSDMVRSVREFVGKIEAAGPEAVAFVYFSGYGFAYEGDNYLTGADAKLDRENDIPLDAVRLSDLLRALDGVPALAKIIAIDAARQLPFGIASAQLAPGLSALEAPPGMVIAYATEPGQVFEDGQGPYGPYATALAEMVRTPGVDIVDDLIRVRERVAQLTEGRQLPWNVSALGQPVVLVPPDTTASVPPPQPLRQARPMREAGPEEAYAFAIERDDLPAYAEYVEAYPDSPYAPQVWAIIRGRRETLAWMRAVDINTPQSYWTYLQRYPNGIYAADAERRLRRLAAPFGPPAGFIPVEFEGVPPPLPYEPGGYVDFHRAPRRFAPPPAALIARQPAAFARLAAPTAPAAGARVLPAPAALPTVTTTVTPGRRFTVAPTTTPNMVPKTVPLSRPNALPSGPMRPNGPPAAAIAPTLAPTGPHPPGPPAAALIAPTVTPNVAPGIEHRRERPPGPPSTAPAIVNRAPPPAALVHPGPPPAVVNRPPPAVVNRPPPAPAIVNRAPPPAAIVRPPPPPVVNRAPPPPVVNRPPPPPAAVARPAPAAAAKKCVVENGKQVCR
jgi:hypothetical protein